MYETRVGSSLGKILPIRAKAAVQKWEVSITGLAMKEEKTFEDKGLIENKEMLQNELEKLQIQKL